MAEFKIPGNPRELWEERGRDGLGLSRVVDLSGARLEELEEAAERITYQLYDRDPSGVVEQEFFNELVGLVRVFSRLPGGRQELLVDGLASSLTCLASLTDRALASGEASPEVLLQHRSSLRAHVFFIAWLVRLVAKAGDSSTGAQSVMVAKAPVRKKSGDGGAGARQPADILPKAIKATAAALNTDLWAVFRPSAPDEQFLLCLASMATAVLDNPVTARDNVAVAHSAHILSALAIKYGRLESVAGSLVELISTRDYTPGPVAELLHASAAKWHDDRLAEAIIAALAAVDPAEYARQQSATGEKAGVRTVAAFLEELAARLPKLLARQMPLMLPHLGGAAHTLRSSIVTACGLLLQRAFEREDDEESAAATAARLRGKQHLLDVLCERVRDTSSYTRKACLAAWQGLAEARALPLGHWALVTDIAVGRLEDKSSLVRREGLRLLQCLLLHNPFGPSLPVGAFAASLATHTAMLEALAPDTEGAEFQSMDVDVERERDEGLASDTGPPHASEPGVPDVKPDPGAPSEPEQGTPAPSPRRNGAEVGWEGGLEELKALVASLELATGFARALAGVMPTLAQLLASANVSDVQETVTLLLVCKQFGVDGVEATARRALPLVFSRDPAIRARLVEAADQLYVTGWAGNLFTPATAARNLMDLACESTLGEVSSQAALIKEFVCRGFLSPATVSELWATVAKASAPAALPSAPGHHTAVRHLRGALAVLSHVVAAAPEATTASQLDTLLRLGLGSVDALAVKASCAALSFLGPRLRRGGDLLPRGPDVARALVEVLLAPVVPPAQWYCAAGPALDALFAVHPAPGAVAAVVLRSLRERVAERGAARDLGPFFFLLGHTALAQLVHVEAQAKRARRAVAGVAESTAGGSPEQQQEGEEEDMNAELGVGSVAADAELEGLRERAEAEILGIGSPLAPHARLVSAVCHSTALLSGDPGLRSSALLCLVKLMVVDGPFCQAHLQLLFTLLQSRSVEHGLRSTLTIALGDLALRFPNMLEGWTERMYRPLTDSEPTASWSCSFSVRKNGLMVLSHLILNDMMKVKGHIAQLAVCLVDTEPRIRSLAELFFHELAKKEVKGTSPIYNLLPDILSNLSADSRLGKAQFQCIMQALLGYIKKDRQGDALVEKLCQRFDASDSLTHWHNISFCLTQLPISDKGLRKLCESFKLYKHTLGDAEVAAAFCSILLKAKKSSAKGELKALVEELESRFAEEARARAEEDVTAASTGPDRDGASPSAVSSLARQLDNLKVEGGEEAGSAEGEALGSNPIKPDPESEHQGSEQPAGVRDLVAKFGGGLTLRKTRHRSTVQAAGEEGGSDTEGSTCISAIHGKTAA